MAERSLGKLPNEINPDFEGQPITPPEGSYFIHGLGGWSKKSAPAIIKEEEISVSLQQDGKTEPIRPFGYIVRLDRGSIRHAASRDLTSRVGEDGQKVPTVSRGLRYDEERLDELIEDTARGKHNELIVDVLKVGVEEAYVLEDSAGTPGVNAFRKACQERGIRIRVIPRVREK